MDIDEQRAKESEKQIAYFGVSAEKIYTDFKVYVEETIKLMMVDEARWYENNTKLEPHAINNSLLEKYKKFCSNIEPTIKIFYEEIYHILSQPNNPLLNTFTGEEMFSKTKIGARTEELVSLQENYKIRKFYVTSLKNRMDTLKKCEDLRTKMGMLSNMHNEIKAQLKLLDLIIASREKMDELLNNFTEKGFDHLSHSLKK